MTASEVLAASGPEADPDREGIRVLLACAVSVLPAALTLDEFVMTACRVFPQLQRFDPTVVADVARGLGIS